MKVGAETVLTKNNGILLRAGGGGGDAGGFGGDAGTTDHGGAITGTVDDASDHSQPYPLRSPEIGLIMGLLGLIGGGVTVVIRRKHTKREKSSKNQMKLYAQKDGSWDENELQKQVRDTYFAVQEAWNQGDMESARGTMSAELYENFTTKLAWMENRGEKNVLKKTSCWKRFPSRPFVTKIPRRIMCGFLFAAI